jgi:hypothetical protein
MNNNFIKCADGWCQLDPIQPSQEEIRQAVAEQKRPWHPLLQGLKRTKCGELVGGPTHPRPLDACPTCADCTEADNI